YIHTYYRDTVVMTDFKVIRTSDRVLVIPADPETLPYPIAFDCNTGVCQRLEQGYFDRAEGEKVATTEPFKASCLLGTIQLFSGRYLMVATKTKRVAVLPKDQHSVFRVDKATLIPFALDQLSRLTSAARRTEEQAYLDMFEWMLNGVAAFYFSFEMDITHTRQRALLRPTQPDARFFWNQQYVQELIDGNCSDWVVPITMGFVQQKLFAHDEKYYRLTLMSRRNMVRAGTRYFMRGADNKGNVANYVETEQIFEQHKPDSDDPTYTAFVQVRGSIPVLWSQYPDLNYKIRVKFNGNDAEHFHAVREHFVALQDLYRDTTAVNLVNKRGDEGRLGESYQKHVQRLSTDTRYIWFDFNAECKHTHMDKLSQLLDKTKDSLTRDGFLHVSEGKVIAMQKGIVRTNCIDNLDRTNVVQTLFALRSLEMQLETLSLPNGILQSSTFSPIFKNIWADNADDISKQYSGTGALKSDFTRTGKVSIKGMLKDGQNSISRYYKNNFNDGFRQDAYNLFTGVYVIDHDAATSEKSLRRPNHKTHILYILSLMIALAAWIHYSYIPASTSFVGGFITFIIYWIGAIILIGYLLKQCNNLLIDWPCLVPL
ncbi:hypothetical protein SAMD00019534_086160, partial [Acytostelium subglobosum LB1]|uniref:hypothetical protein n=1 Tax=Acytostelium subglobosum LB1 TaxID=1410327 RepID=UPI000644C909